ncbi:MAG: cupin domain-containing protein [Nitrospirae bacterium]|nr:cupin domain-containing protein [Nitrospirota bacterium]MCL5977951.1 cupin domain-containing protein [Nitrospirota bacterium]
MKKTKKTPQHPYLPNAPSCDWKSPKIEQKSGRTEAQKSTIYKHKGGFTWSGVKTEKYKQKDGNWSAIVRNVLIGNHGETAKFHLRYFEITPGGCSSLERHKHEHVVICVRGKGKIRMGKKFYALNYLDTAYVAPDTVHQLTNPFDEPFGFFCIVNAKRDKPKSL